MYRKPSNYPARATLDAIDKTLTDSFGVTVKTVMGAGRQRMNVYLRFAISAIFSELTGLSDSEVMRYLGGERNRTNIVYARKQVSSLMPYPDFCDKYNVIKDGTLKLLTEWNISLE
ncbi:MAG: hypothetical protein J5733_09040 [Bacteroidaceae bacterium]|nr:hypothetical protein [Bacteroidaceae bacterium]